MVAICCVCGIEKGTWRDFDLTFHSFPKNEDLRLKWYEAIGKKVYRNACVCSKHFKTEDYRNHEDPNLIRRLLKPSAVPDNNLFRDVESVETSSRFNPVNVSVGNNNDESVDVVNRVSSEYQSSIVKNETSDDSVQANESNTSIKINNPKTKRRLDDKAISYSTANQQIKKRKTEDCHTHTLQSIEKQGKVVSGVVRKEDFKNVNAWLRFQKYINEMRKQYKFLLHKNRRLYLKLNNFKDMLDTLRTK
ncbi:uncharacterized protein LOC112464422 [Temnothorax curvispinosus]|uniref:Uncharacterized protein LOC112464422 n=1 Tax=Temnothorax curvispinosus TaxID=300111 RepID=A0A6J1QZ67_9HYME|nr:uncharacterized protein LOC112464422 [Temnothorax curvispinosus]